MIVAARISVLASCGKDDTRSLTWPKKNARDSPIKTDQNVICSPSPCHLKPHISTFVGLVALFVAIRYVF